MINLTWFHHIHYLWTDLSPACSLGSRDGMHGNGSKLQQEGSDFSFVLRLDVRDHVGGSFGSISDLCAEMR